MNKTEPVKGISCPKCGCRHFNVLETRPTNNNRLRRRKECRHCGYRVTTHESLQTENEDEEE
jgi:transcriptional regulator NrdR family protein